MIGIYTCFGGCDTGIAAAKACIRVWEEFKDKVKIACLPAVAVPIPKITETQRKAEKRILIDACAARCGAKILEKEGMPVDRHIELTSELGIEKRKSPSSKDLEEKVYMLIRDELYDLLEKRGKKSKS